MTEVLISMGVLTFGLLGVAALFPVGGHYMRTGEVQDRAAAVAQTAFNDLVTRGMLNPDNWMTHSTSPLDDPNRPFQRPHTDRFREYSATDLGPLQLVDDDAGVADRQRMVNVEFGSTFVIDPLGVAVTIDESLNLSPAFRRVLYSSVRLFPYDAPRIVNAVANNNASWNPWGAANNLPFPVKRLSIAMANPNQGGSEPAVIPMTLARAEAIFTSNEDLRSEVLGNDSPAVQYWEERTTTNNAIPEPLKREAQGDFSWLATISPSSSGARDSLAEKDGGFAVEVSVVVFYKRLFSDTSVNPEKLVRARLLSTSLSGGELVLEPTPGLPAIVDRKQLFPDLSPGQWVMLSAPHPQSRAREPLFFTRWYRVLAVEGEDVQLDKTGTPVSGSDPQNPRRLVTLRGPQWPWQPANNMNNDQLLENDLRVGIFPGAVAVHTRTMRMEGNSLWSVE